MNTGIRAVAVFALAVMVSMGSFASQVTAKSASAAKPPAQTPAKSAKELFWEALAPEPEEDVIIKYQEGKITRADAMKYLDKLGKTPILDVDNRYVRVPGYLVPLNLDTKQKATELLLVPTMGSCIHVPPPPPNQTVFIEYPKGIEVEEAGYTPYWVTGTIKVEKGESEYTETLYTMKVEKIEEYEFD